MRVFTVAIACLLGAACVPAARGVPVERSPAASDRADAARDVLVYHCGRCHRSDLPSAVPGALAIFDLTEDLWYRNVSAEQLDHAVDRLRAEKDIDPRDLATMEAFVASAK